MSNIDQYRFDPLITHVFSKKEFLEVLSKKVKKSSIGEDIQIIVSNKLRIFKKISDNKIEEIKELK